MAEAEDVLVDAARHAADHLLAWRSRRRVAPGKAVPDLGDVGARLDLLLCATSGRAWKLRVAQPPAPATLLARLFRGRERPWPALALPASLPGVLWLPRELPAAKAATAVALYRAMALLQAERAQRAPPVTRPTSALLRDLALVFEAERAEAALLARLPGLAVDLQALRAAALRLRPPVDAFAPGRRTIERWLRERLQRPTADARAVTAEPVDAAREQAASWPDADPDIGLWKDWWTGDHAPCDAEASAWHGAADDATGPGEAAERALRSARLTRRPRVRAAVDDEDDRSPGAWMVQTAQPQEHAEDPLGLQRPLDREPGAAADGAADSVAGLPEARLVHSSAPAREVVLSDDLPLRTARATPAPALLADGVHRLSYPEWDWRRQAYREPGAIVWPSLAPAGDAAWVARTLREQHALLAATRRQFELLRARRLPQRRLEEGDELDLDACIDARAQLRAGGPMPVRLYRHTRELRRDAAVLVLVDVSGSTDSWIDGRRRVIDVEREALLPLSIALDALGDPCAILAFSGLGPGRVDVREVKRFGERHGADVALRIAGLEPERSTRCGAALRHASQLLARQCARHRLLLMLSDGKPCDEDEYEGRYGVEDLRQAVAEAREAGQRPFCLTIDRQAASYLPRVFGPHHYALLQQPARLPQVLLGWMKRLLVQ
jgi:nitric oxide reductase NorD protein